MDFATGFAAGLVFGKKKFGGGGDEEWKPPDHWLDMPDPEPNQIIIYVEAQSGDVAPIIGLYGDNYDGGTINYGDDGYTYEYPASYEYNPFHVYQTAGQYIITVTAAGNEVCLSSNGTNVAFMAGNIYDGSFGGYNSGSNQCQCIRAIKIGSDIQLERLASYPIAPDRYGDKLVYIEFMGEIKNVKPLFKSFDALKKIKVSIPPEAFGDYSFQNCLALEKADCLQRLKTIPSGLFSGCYSLKSVDMPLAESEDGAAFNTNCYSLKSVYAPALTEITADEFNSCYSLQKLTLANNCNYNGNKFENCVQLYPKPQ